MIILDTNVVSELMKPTPAQQVVEWVARCPAPTLHTTSVTQAEVLRGVALLPVGRRRTALATQARAMFEEDFKGRVLPFGADAAPVYAEIAAARQRAGRPISQFDAQIAAIARSCSAQLATRNVADFVDCGIVIVDPWTS